MGNKTGQIIQNVATLDLRSATAETLAGIQRVNNVATLIYSTENAELVTSLNIQNVASMIKLPKDAHLMTGQEELSRRTFQDLSEPLALYVTGQLMIKPDIPIEELRSGLDSLYVTGQLFYPESLASVVKSKLREINGQALAYSDDAKFIMGKLVLTESYLRSIEDQSVLLVFGRLDATELLPNDLIAQKVKQIEVLGRVTCREENADTLLPRVKNTNRVTIIPSGFVYLAQPLTLDANMVELLPGKQLYGATLIIEKDVTAEALDAAIDALVVTELLVAPTSLRRTLGQKCKLLETPTVFYEDEIWLIDGESTLNADRFTYLEGKATLVVRGELTIDPTVEPQLLAQHLAKVHNWGEIHCTPAQMSALQARLGTNQGEFVDNSVAAAEEEVEAVIGNAAYLVL